MLLQMRDLIQVLRFILVKKAERMYDCENYLVFKMKDGRLKLYQAYFCKTRLWPLCNWRRSLKIAFQNKKTFGRSMGGKR